METLMLLYSLFCSEYKTIKTNTKLHILLWKQSSTVSVKKKIAEATEHVEAERGSSTSISVTWVCCWEIQVCLCMCACVRVFVCSYGWNALVSYRDGTKQMQPTHHQCICSCHFKIYWLERQGHAVYPCTCGPLLFFGASMWLECKSWRKTWGRNYYHFFVMNLLIIQLIKCLAVEKLPIHLQMACLQTFYNIQLKKGVKKRSISAWYIIQIIAVNWWSNFIFCSSTLLDVATQQRDYFLQI